MSAVPRQVWLSGRGFAPCEHTSIREIRNSGGDVIRVECSACSSTIWELGTCNGCLKERQQCAKFKSTRNGWLRFCNGVCETIYLHNEKLRRRVDVKVK